VKVSCTDLCGGREVTRVPTATRCGSAFAPSDGLPRVTNSVAIGGTGDRELVGRVDPTVFDPIAEVKCAPQQSIVSSVQMVRRRAIEPFPSVA
jgi:hypothetical protein